MDIVRKLHTRRQGWAQDLLGRDRDRDLSDRDETLECSRRG